MWAQTVGAQWLFVDDPNAPTIVALVQTATQLPVMLLALPAGSWPTRSTAAGCCSPPRPTSSWWQRSCRVLAAAGRMTPALMLALMFAAGVGLAAQVPTWQPRSPSSCPDPVGRCDPAGHGQRQRRPRRRPRDRRCVIAVWGVPPVFAFTAAAAAVLAAVLLLWRRPPPDLGDRERFLPALRAGGRYVRHEPVVRVILLRLAMFFAPAAALWALLPLIATRRLGLARRRLRPAVRRPRSRRRHRRPDPGPGHGSTCRPTPCSHVGCVPPSPWRSARMPSPRALARRYRCSSSAGFGWTATVPPSSPTSAVPARLGARPRHRRLPDELPRAHGHRLPPIWGAAHPTPQPPTAIYTAAALVASAPSPGWSCPSRIQHPTEPR